MAVKVVVGAQFGDEGKGKMVDWLAKDADIQCITLQISCQYIGSIILSTNSIRQV